MYKQCPYCKHEWEARVDNPKECPRCKNRLDYQRKKPYKYNTTMEEKEE